MRTHIFVGQDVSAELALDTFHLAVGVVDNVHINVGCCPGNPDCSMQPCGDLEGFMATIA